MNEPRRLAEEIKARALAEGFDGVALARAAALERDEARLSAWLAGDRHAAMAWMAREPSKRADPRLLLPGCRTVVVLAMSYWPGPEAASTPDGRGRVALYARGRDYHKVLGRRARRLAAWIEESSGAAARSFVDTGPVLERAWAERAGLGWIGKNSNLLTRRMGSWLLLAEVLSCAEIEPDRGPHADHCGSCTACIDACPTDAIIHDGVVDSRRCIAYWTIEHRGVVPEQRRAGNGDWIFGCDVCQDVCPWNAHRTRTGHPRFSPGPLGRGPLLADLLELDAPGFTAATPKSAVKRARRDGLVRSALTAAGNSGDRALGEKAARLLADDAAPSVRRHAAWALGRLAGAPARRALEAARADDDPSVRDEVARALDGLG